MKLYYAPNTIATASAIALFEAGIPFEAIKVDFAQQQQTSPDYLTINKKARVPALVTASGTLTETGAILEFIADQPGGMKLRPKGAYQAAKMREWLHYLASTMHINHAHSKRGYRWANAQTSFEDMQAKVPETMGQSCALIEELMVGPFLLGDDLGLADCHLYALLRWLPGDGVDIADYPRLAALKHAMEMRDSVRAAHDAGIFTNQ